MHWKFNHGSGISHTVDTRVILVRHGQSTFNAQGRYQGCSDEPVLTEKGHSGARATGVSLRGLDIDTIYISPLQRVIDTTSEILEVITDVDCSPKLQIDHKLTEINLPTWQGLSFQYVREQFAEEYRCWKERPHEFMINVPQVDAQLQHVLPTKAGRHNFLLSCTEKSFPVLELYEQARQFWQETLPRHVGKTVLVVSHSGTNRALISTALGIAPDRYHVLQQSNCGISILNFPANCGSLGQLQLLNHTTHLGETLPKLKEGKQGLRLLLVPLDTINPPQVHHLAEFLKPASIDFSLSSSSSSQEVAELILQYHPKTVQLQVLRQDFSEAWQYIQSRRAQVASNCETESAPLMTGLVVACNSMIRNILGNILGMSPDDFWRLQLNSGSLSVIHYPSKDSSPGLQGINITPVERSPLPILGVN